MSDDIEQYGLHIPEQEKTEKDGFDIRTKQVTAWIEALPLGDTEETARKHYSVLSQVNRIEVNPSTRLRLLEQLEPSLGYATDALKKQFQGKSFPLSNKSLKAVDKTLALLSERSYAYKIATIDLLQKPGLFNKGTLQQALRNSILSLKDILLTTYQIYAPVPAYLWFELHRLYQLAEERGLADKPLKLENNRSSSVEHAYKQALLLSIANPYHLRPQEILQIQNSADEWCELIRIRKPDKREMIQSQYASVLTSDAPPSHLNLLKTLDGKNTRLVDISALMAHLRSQINQEQSQPLLPRTGTGILPDHVLLKRLLSSWEIRKKRSFSRSPQGEKLDVSVGLNGTHFLIEAESGDELDRLLDTLEPTRDVEEEYNPLDIIHTQFSIEPIPGEAKGETYWGKPTRHTSSTVGEGFLSSHMSDPVYQKNTLKTVNVSAGGYCLLWDHDRTSNVQVGELVGIRESSASDDDGNWRIGVVRWMQYVRNQGVKLGIEILSPSANPISARALKRKGRNHSQEYSCLSLPEIRTMHQPATLLTPPMHYKVGDALIVNDHGKLNNVQLTRLMENSGNFLRFQYTPLNEKEEAEFDRSLNEQSGEWFKLIK